MQQCNRRGRLPFKWSCIPLSRLESGCLENLQRDGSGTVCKEFVQSPSPHLYAKRHFIIKTRIPLIPYVWTSAQRNKKRLTPRSGEKRPIIVAGKTVGHQLFHFVPASFVPFFHKPRFEKAVSASIKQLEIDSYYISGPRHTPSCSRKSRQYVVPLPRISPLAGSLFKS